MLKAKLVLVSCVAIVAGLVAVRAASGSIPNTNYLTFGAPFALPGVSLPAGTYVFDVLATGSRNIVRVTSRDRSRIYLTAFTVTVLLNRSLSSRIVSAPAWPLIVTAPVTGSFAPEPWMTTVSPL